MFRALTFAMLLLVTTVALGGAAPFTPELARDASASCVPDVTDRDGCVQSPLPVPCRPFEGAKYLGNLDVCLM